MYKRALLWVGLGVGCESEEKEVQQVPEEWSCPSATYPALFQVWSNREERNLVDVPPLCEAAFDIEIGDDGQIYSGGECVVQNGQQNRILVYEFQGMMEEDGEDVGEVRLTKRNGEEELASFSASCVETEAGTEIEITWSMIVTTPNGEIIHNGSLATE